MPKGPQQVRPHQGQYRLARLGCPDGSELFVEVLDGLAVSPRFKVKAELSHVLEVWLYLLPCGESEGFHAKLACPVNVALLHMRGSKRVEQPWPGLDDARVEGGQGRCQHVLRGV